MKSIFDPPTGARTFNASDWLAAIDVQLQAPPNANTEQSADAWPTDETPIEDSGPWTDTQPDGARGRTARAGECVTCPGPS